ncbi:peptide MFS transporter [Phenylobacterium sp.]|uniref:peptide MFS transporter n=1 Tax=Phenylobacterium sp. TaxID=1871053 RepID=UPI0025D2AE44|nr:peptide MFS transporter [Phenylobacterium sp.]
MDIVFIAGIVITLVTAIPVVMQLRTHPRGLVILFFAEMWERFSYYGMRGLLIFYLTQHFLFDDKTAQGQYGAYTSLVYLLPLVGGFLADRFLGTRKAIAFGALLLVAGHLTMAFEGKPVTQVLQYQNAKYEFVVTGRGAARDVKLKLGEATYGYGPSADGGLQITGLPPGAALPSVLPKGSYALTTRDDTPIFRNVLYLALALIIMGVGFLKANISSLVGQLYPKGDPRRDPGFTLYYYGINLGSFWAGIACGWLGQNLGWNWGFGAAGVGMLAGYVVFTIGKPLLQGKGEPPDPVKLAAPVAGPLTLEHLIYVGGLAGVALVWFLVQRNAVVGYLLAAGSIVTLGYLAFFMATKCTRQERERMILALVLVAGAVVFWTLFEQAGSSLNQFAERNTDLAIGFGQSITPAQTQSFNPGFILLFAPVFAAIWAFLGTRRLDPNPALKFGLGLGQVAAGFFVLVLGAHFAGPDFKVPVVFLVLAYLLHTTGELCLSPVGLSQMTKLAPAAVISTIMATWFLASSWAQWIGGLIAQMTATETVAGQVLDPGKALATYVDVFKLIGFWGLGAAALMLVASPILKKWAHGASDTYPQATVEPPVDGQRQTVPL